MEADLIPLLLQSLFTLHLVISLFILHVVFNSITKITSRVSDEGILDFVDELSFWYCEIYDSHPLPSNFHNATYGFTSPQYHNIYQHMGHHSLISNTVDIVLLGSTLTIIKSSSHEVNVSPTSYTVFWTLESNPVDINTYFLPSSNQDPSSSVAPPYIDESISYLGTMKLPESVKVRTVASFPSPDFWTSSPNLQGTEIERGLSQFHFIPIEPHLQRPSHIPYSLKSQFKCGSNSITVFRPSCVNDHAKTTVFLSMFSASRSDHFTDTQTTCVILVTGLVSIMVLLGREISIRSSGKVVHTITLMVNDAVKYSRTLRNKYLRTNVNVPMPVPYLSSGGGGGEEVGDCPHTSTGSLGSSNGHHLGPPAIGDIVTSSSQSQSLARLQSLAFYTPVSLSQAIRRGGLQFSQTKEEAALDILARQLSVYRMALEKFTGHPISLRLDQGNYSVLKVNMTRKVVAVLFTDIVGFTAMTERFPSSVLLSILNDYFAAITETVLSHNGVVDKFLGDGVLAFFECGDTCSLESAVTSACKCALDIQNMTSSQSEGQNQGHMFGLDVRVGIHAGDCLLGCVGCSTRLSYTVMGDSVNTASRLESKTRELGVKVLISQSAARHCSDKILFRRLGGVRLKGKERPLEVCEVFATHQDAQAVRLMRISTSAQDLFDRRVYSECVRVLLGALEEFPDDRFLAGLLEKATASMGHPLVSLPLMLK
eukprot:gnl/Dysnectes_brevis/10946_a22419_124.p1 GENE.gnl/Dysnectes_brevis/10946_a22419_124~~gnl/Dysnectes_brevis/10946_a22419_124.p1  ORF type:complete len:710 (-),score=172.17 gnl/Dysnectes_brevis/10946_a22419_124:36-2165(-)